MARYVMRARRFIAHNILHADDTPHRIALGVGIAMWIGLLPLIGFQTVIAVACAAVFRANKAVCVPVVWVTNPLTMVPIYGSCLAFGRFLLSLGKTSAHSAIDIEAQISSHLGAHEGLGRFLSLEFWGAAGRLLIGFGAELWLGCVIVGLVLAVASYFLSRWGVVAMRDRHRQRVLRRSMFRARLKGAKVTRKEPA